MTLFWPLTRREDNRGMKERYASNFKYDNTIDGAYTNMTGSDSFSKKHQYPDEQVKQAFSKITQRTVENDRVGSVLCAFPFVSYNENI